jgi:hypothetical protein
MNLVRSKPDQIGAIFEHAGGDSGDRSRSKHHLYQSSAMPPAQVIGHWPRKFGAAAQG